MGDKVYIPWGKVSYTPHYHNMTTCPSTYNYHPSQITFSTQETPVSVNSLKPHTVRKPIHREV
jgi:hypothetical protein